MSIFNRIVLGLLVVVHGTQAFAADLGLGLAERLFESRAYEDAVTEYKRFVFCNPAHDSVGYALHKIGLAYRNRQRWAESLDAFRQAIQIAVDDSIRNEREIALAVVLIASGDHAPAEFQLIKVESFTRFPVLKKKAAFFRGISTLYAFKWEDARKAFRVYFDESPEARPMARRVDSLLALACDLKYKSPTIAKTLSTILPGAGQVYAGDWRNGVNALGLNLATGYLLFGNAARGNYRTALLSYFFLFSRYYLGNRNHAERMADAHNRRMNELWTQRILDTLLSGSSGL